MLDVLDYLSNGAIAIARRVLDLRADIGLDCRTIAS
jgi:hypothetical protein